MIKEIFSKTCIKHNYEMLPEKSLIRQDSDTFFVASSIMANMDLFKCPQLFIGKKYFTVQRCFSATRINDAGKYPLATPFEVMMSFFRFGDTSPKEAIKFLFVLLEELIGKKADNLYYLAPYELGIRKTIEELDVPEDNLISWVSQIPLNLGKNNPKGYYLKVFMPYHHGVIPVATVGFVYKDDVLCVDSALFMERLDMVKNNYHSWFEGKYYKSLFEAIKLDKAFAFVEVKVIRFWTIMLKTISILLCDGASLQGKGSGHVVRKLLRKLIWSDREIEFDKLNVIKFEPILRGILLEDINNIEVINLVEKLTQVQELLIQMNKQVEKEINNFNKYLNEINDSINIVDLEKWYSERGIDKVFAIQILSKKGITNIQLKEETKNSWFRNACYSFDSKLEIKDIYKFILDFESKRLKGAK